MAEDGGPTVSGRAGPPGLGPHVVGRRVVVRRLLPGLAGPTGGPAFTDVLGVCERWDTAAGELLVRREDGSAVPIRLADVVSGKPVPPRPSVRMRVSARDAEGHALALWPCLETEPLGDWLLRSQSVADDPPVKRANSALAMGDPGLPVDDAAQRVRAFYRARGRPVLAQVERGGDRERELTAQGWTEHPDGGAEFRLGSVARTLRRLQPPVGLPEVPVVVEGPEARVADASVRARVVLDGDWLGVHDLWVEPARRRRGLARATLGVLLDWGASQGASTVWLHVRAESTAAIGLYDDLGLAVHHRYGYLLGPELDDDGDAGGEADGDADGPQSRAGTGR